MSPSYKHYRIIPVNTIYMGTLTQIHRILQRKKNPYTCDVVITELFHIQPLNIKAGDCYANSSFSGCYSQQWWPSCFCSWRPAMGFIGEFPVPSLSLIFCLFVRLETVEKVHVFLRLSLSYIGVPKRKLTLIILITTPNPWTLKLHINLLSKNVPPFL